MKRILPIIMMLMLASFGLAESSLSGNLMTVHCDGSAGTDTFFEGEEVCVYGVGFDTDSAIDIILEDDSQVVATSTESTNDNGVISLRNIWNTIGKGIYNYFADINQNGERDDNEHSQSLFVIGEPIEENPNNTEDVEEVPEFGTVAALFVLGIAGLFIYKKRGTSQ